MAPSFPASRRWLQPLLLLLIALNARPNIGCYTAIFSFGDSLADTGNSLPSCVAENDFENYCRLPYGETYFHRPTGRFSDGRVMIDFIAQAMGLPFVQPYLSGGEGFAYGANFAVGGATALPNSFFRSKGIEVRWTNYSLGVQLGWFKELLPTLCASVSDCGHLLSNSLFLVGEIGGNDYNQPFFHGRSHDEVRTYTPSVVAAISSAVTELIEHGARTLVVPGNFPIGCISAYLTLFPGRGRGEEEYYDPATGCIKWLNEFAEEYHNRLLLEELERLRRLHPHATIVYADYYNAAMSVYRSPHKFGFGATPLAACCGGGGAYNYNQSALCGFDGAKVCDDPSSFIVWDGLHMTEAAYSIIAEGLLRQYTTPPIAHICPQVVNNGNNYVS